MSAAQVDVAVVGGGLAGCAAALALARSGHSVALFEAKAYPHDKVCGEFLSPESRRFLEALGVMKSVQRLEPTSIRRARILAPSGGSWTGAFQQPGLGISRRALDQTLADSAQAAGVQLHTHAPVSDVRGSLDDGFVVTARTPGGAQTLQARAVVGAYGKRGTLDRALARGFMRDTQTFVGLKAHFHGPSPGNCVDLYTFDGGYCGLSAVEGGRVNACLLVRQDVFRRAAGQPASVERFVAWMARQNPALGQWLAASHRMSPEWLSISQVSFAPKRAVEGDMLMAGDTAGLIAPLAGDGMSMALHGGLLAAAWLGAFLRGDTGAVGLRAGYARAWQGAFRRRLTVGRFLQAVLLRPRWLEAGLRLVTVAPALGQYFVHQTRDPGLARL